MRGISRSSASRNALKFFKRSDSSLINYFFRIFAGRFHHVLIESEIPPQFLLASRKFTNDWQATENLRSDYNTPPRQGIRTELLIVNSPVSAMALENLTIASFSANF